MRLIKLLLFVILCAVCLSGSLFGSTRDLKAAPQLLTVMPSGSTLIVSFRVQDDVGAPGNNSAVTLSASTGTGTFSSGGIIPADGGASCSPTGIGTGTLTYSDQCLDTIDIDGAEETQPPLASQAASAVWQCNATGAVTITLTQAAGISGGNNTLSQQAQCTLGSSGTSLIAVTAAPNALVCGGTTIITAALLGGSTGGSVATQFHFQTDVGQLIQQSDTTAVLALLPGQTSATVTASTVGILSGSTAPVILTGTVLVQNFCGNQILTTNAQTYAISVVASPNVIPCGGTANITATARDTAGRIIPGVGFSFTADVGVLSVGPANQAGATSNTATLALQPGMGKKDDGVVDEGVRVATVTAAVGSDFGTVRVQQFCPGVTTDSSTAPGKIVLTASKTVIGCNGTTFIGAVVKDSKGQVPPNDTEVTFLATSGSFSSTNTASGTAQVSATPGAATVSTAGYNNAGDFIAKTTKNGSLNVIYRAGPDTDGNISISAAAGSTFGNLDVTVNCPITDVSGATGTGVLGGSGTSSGGTRGGGCTPIGVGICIRPPNTGDAGLAELR